MAVLLPAAYPDGTKISWKYDSLLRPVQMNRTAAGRDPRCVTDAYDLSKGVSFIRCRAVCLTCLSKTDQNGRSINYTYDCMGRILTVSGSAGQEKSYTYDAMGNVTSATDADGNVTKYAYSYLVVFP